MWLKEENPAATEYKKLLTLENKPYDSQRLNKLIEELYPICYFTSDKESDFRNKEKLLKIVCEDCESLKNFYDELKTTDRKQTDLL